MKMIPLEERDGRRCYFCGATKSVKYMTEVTSKILGEMEVDVCNRCALIKGIANEETHTHYQLTNGTLVSKTRVDSARELLNSLMYGFTVTELTDDELFSKGDKVEAVMRYHNKFNCSAAEAKSAIERLRQEGK